MDTASCLSIIVAKLHLVDPDGMNHYGTELATYTGDFDALQVAYDEYVPLETVNKVSVDRDLVYDEGEARIIYVDHTVTVEAVLTNSTNFGNYIESFVDIPAGSGLRPPTFNEKVEKMVHLLSNQGLGINFMNYPNPIRRLMPGNENNDPIGSGKLINAYVWGKKGWLVDNFNGPKTLSVNTHSIAGGEAVALTWKVKFRTSHTDYAVTTDTLIPRISSELRLDIGEDGDLRVVVDGTIYANSLPEIYAARNWLDVRFQPDEVTGIIKDDDDEDVIEDRWAMVNGFKKSVTFNVEKNGRSAKFSVTYSQVKSNSAYPLGIRDIEFEQEISSSFTAKNPLQGKMFTTWKQTFKCKITIPPRFDARYAWYIMQMLQNQQMRLAELKFDAKSLDSEDPDVPEKETETSSSVENKRYTMSKALLIGMKINHKHYARTINFETEFVIMCPLSKILTASCILNRINNDYQRRIDKPDKRYIPIPLSAQWHSWNRSTDSQNAYDPTQEDQTNPFHRGKPHRDTAGTEIVDTGHNYDPYRNVDNQPRQSHLMIMTVADPNEIDPSYGKNLSEEEKKKANNLSLFDQLPPGYPPGRRLRMPNATPIDQQDDDLTGIPLPPAVLPATTHRPNHDVDKKVSWIVFSQEYEISETNPTIPTESLSDISKQDYTASNELLYSYGVTDENGYHPENSPNYHPPNNGDTVAEDSGFKMKHRESVNERSPDEVPPTDPEKLAEWKKKKVVSRKTYAIAPPRYYLTVRGHAIRVKHKIPIPSVLKIAGMKAVRVGTGRFRHKNLAPGADLPVYQAMWEQTYTIDKSALTPDILDTIEDTGASVLYNV